GQRMDNVVKLPVRKPWQEDCSTGKKGGLIPNVANALIALQRDPDLRDNYAFDQMVHVVKVHRELGLIDTCDRWLTDADVIALQVWMQQKGGFPGMSLETLRNAVTVRANECAYHPV